MNIQTAESWTKKLNLGTGPVSPEVYTDQAQFELERDKIFRRYWLNLGRESDIPKAGDYIFHDIPLLKVSVVLCENRQQEVFRVRISRLGVQRQGRCRRHSRRRAVL